MSTNTTIDRQPQVACYRRGTRIRTERGEAAIECLSIGDHVTTAIGEERILWVGYRSYSRGLLRGNKAVLPIRIAAGALEGRSPRRDLWVSPNHALYVDGMLVAARDLVNGLSIVQESALDEVTYFHLELAAHAVIFAEGAPAESFVDDGCRDLFDNAADYHRRYPGAIRHPAQLCAPRLEEGWELDAVRRRLTNRAGFLNSYFRAVARSSF